MGVSYAVVDKVHRSSTWVKVQIRIIKYYSSKSKSTAFSILLEWKYKSTGFFMYLSKKVLIDRFIFQFYIDYLRSFYISTYFYNPTAQNTWDFPKITTIWSQDIYFVVMFTVKLTLRCTWEKTDLTIYFSPIRKKCFKTSCQLYMTWEFGLKLGRTF